MSPSFKTRSSPFACLSQSAAARFELSSSAHIVGCTHRPCSRCCTLPILLPYISELQSLFNSTLTHPHLSNRSTLAQRDEGKTITPIATQQCQTMIGRDICIEPKERVQDRETLRAISRETCCCEWCGAHGLR